MEKKKYKIAELANILGVSEPAVRKKVTSDGLEKRYKKLYEVIVEDDTMFILLDDIELEKEKELAFKNKNKFSSKDSVREPYTQTVENVDYIEVTPEIQQNNEFSQNHFVEFTKRYIDRLENLYSTLDEIRRDTVEKDKQILLLEDFKNRDKQDIIELQANNKTLSEKLEAQKKRYIKTIIGLSVTFFIIVLVLTIFLSRAYY